MQNLRRLILLSVSLWFLWAVHGFALTIVTWNLEWFPGRSPTPSPEAKQQHMTAAQAVLKEINPDVFLAQEVADWKAFQELISIVPGLQPHIVSSFRDPFGVTRQQVAVASKLNPNSAWYEPWKRSWADPPRGYAFAALEMSDGQLLMVYTLHFKSNLSRREADAQLNIGKREDATEQLLAHVHKMEKIYGRAGIRGWIIGGDFNTNTEGDQFISENSIRLLECNGWRNGWEKVPQNRRLTWVGNKQFPPTTFDFIFLKQLGNATPRIWRVPASASDHLPVVVRVEDE